jgi:hypothetical protein
MAISGHNGNNETKIGISNALSFTVFDESKNEVKISKLNSPVDLKIQRDTNLPQYSYQFVNASRLKLPTNSFILQNAINIKTINSSLHIELKPFNNQLGYLVLIKLGAPPILNLISVDYTSFKIFCPSKLPLSIFS